MFEIGRHEEHAPSLFIARVVIAAAITAILLPGTVAGAEDSPSTRIRLTKHAKAKIRLTQLYQSRGHLDGADVIGGETILRPSVRIPYAKWGEIDLSTRYDIRIYDFDGRSDLVDGVESGGTPFDVLNSYRIRLGTNLKIRKGLFISTGGFIGAKWESGANLDNATRAGGFAGIGWQPHPRVLLGLGVGVRAELEGGDTRVAPIWRIHWQIHERVDLLAQNLTSRIRIELNRDFQLQLIARYDKRKYWLQDRGDERASWLKVRRIPLRLRLMWRRSDRNRLDFDIGAYFDQRLKTDAADSKQSIDQGTTVFVGMGIRFRN